MGHVCARKQQQKADCAQKDKKRRSNIPPEPVTQWQDPDRDLSVRQERWGRGMGLNNFHLRAGLFHGDAGFQASDHVMNDSHPVAALLFGGFILAQWSKKLDGFRHGEMKFARHDADDHKNLVIEPYIPADRRITTAEALLPKAV